MARNVPPEVKNAAMKKLFADPHFNTMDMLDVYVDDYGKPDPMPASMLRQLVSAKYLNLFDDEDDKPKTPGTGDDANTPASADVAQSNSLHDSNDASTDAPTTPHTLSQPGSATQAAPSPPPHDDPDLQLQPNHAPGHQGTGQGIG